MAAQCAAFTLLSLVLMSSLPGSWGHGWVTVPPARNAQAGTKNGYCPHCGNGNGICGDGNQWPRGSDYLNFYQGPVETWRAGTVVEVEVKVTAHHKGHYEFSICDQVLTSAVLDPQACLDKWILQRASPAEAGLTDCTAGDRRAGCQPLDSRHPERFYLPPPGFSADGSNTHRFFLKLPAGLKCAACTMQWRWWSANSCIPASDYGCYAAELSSQGWTNAADWGLRGSCPGGGCDRCGCGEEFRNCVDITVLPASGAPATTRPPPVTTVSTTAPSVTTTGGASGGDVEECVPQSVLTCINDKSGFWPKCDPAQTKNVVGPAGYEFGEYCTQEWTDALNEMLSDPAVGKCSDREAIHKMLAQVAYETGYFSTVYQPKDGGAGLIHMIPGNWPVNAADMDVLFPRQGQHYEQIAVAMGKDFFQSADYGWKSVAAWFKRTNTVIPGCGLDLFDQDFDEQTRCILSRVVSRKEAFDIVDSCLPDANGPTLEPTAMPLTPLPTSAPVIPSTPAPTALPTGSETTSTTSVSFGITCKAAAGFPTSEVADERCQSACQLLGRGSWPCGDGDGNPCTCGETDTTTQSKTTSSFLDTTVTTTESLTPRPTSVPVSPRTPTPTALPTGSETTSTTSASFGITCKAAAGFPTSEATDERCQSACQLLQPGSWPCGDGDGIPCTCGETGTTTQSKTTSSFLDTTVTTTTTTDPLTPRPTSAPVSPTTPTPTAPPTVSATTSTTSASFGSTCKAAAGFPTSEATDERCQSACQLVQRGSWPCGDGVGHPCTCGETDTATITILP